MRLRSRALPQAAALLMCSAAAAGAQERSNVQIADVGISSVQIDFQPLVAASTWSLTVTGPGGFVFEQRGQRTPPPFSVLGSNGQYLADGVYSFELRAEMRLSSSAVAKTGGETTDGRGVVLRTTLPPPMPPLSGGFTVAGGAIIPPDAQAVEPMVRAPLVDSSGVLVPTPEDQLVNDDLIVDGSACIGFDCINGESFGFDTLRLKENNLRIRFMDTSSSASFPTNDWQITANETSNGGANKFSIDDIDGGKTPFTIEAGARSHSLYVDDGGRLGFGTSTPVVELHSKDGDSPTLRLEQDGSSGFTPQTWDVAGNETNFFVRDVTNGSRLPFRIRPNAPSDSIFVDNDGDVGLGTSSPSQVFHVSRSGNVLPQFQSSNNGAVQIRLKTNSTNRRIIAVDGGDNQESQIVLLDDGAFQFLGPSVSDTRLEITSNGNLFVQGACSEGGNPGSGSCADYVFESDYALPSLDELGAFIAENKHLPNVPSTEEIRRDGVNLQHFQGRLLEKIEELTLYILSQHETIRKLEERLAALESEPTK